MISFWILAALMTLAVIAILVVPLFETSWARDEKGMALNIYRDQLTEIDRDKTLGMLPQDQARAAQLEIQRRILALGDTSTAQPSRALHNRFIAITAVLLPIFGVLLYLNIGAVRQPDQPLVERQVAAPATPEFMALRDRVSRHPDDVEAWLALARLAFDQQRLEESLEAFRHVLALGKTGADIYADYGLALIRFHDGEVSSDAKAAFVKALGLNPKESRARFFLALAKAQEGNLTGAVTDWVALERDTPADAPYRKSLSEAIDKAARQLGKDPATLPGREPAK
ncbi:c-type cytochrome biogenesis protein CcmI [Dongia soli]|uniref:C-type cytochrome biogenesis protein CcmI n=1 Tax=Dongia soli TaxID=600628 RepID=A0ABU5EI75_9PROT|nr:c-type cytochrome biogenesis protein CcmI [Dongia soli]MDY0885881.1 c-type cytochrome biogenesis protein CcmI [Dongia soli]